MPHLLKIYISILLLFCSVSITNAQELEYLPPVINTKPNADTGVCLLLNTLDFARDERQVVKKPYTYSIQIVDAVESWPPRWYTAKPVYTNEMYSKDSATRTRRMNFIENPEINGDYIFYLQIYPLNKVLDQTKTFDVQHSAVFAVMDKNLNLVDSIACGRYTGGNYGPNFTDNEQIEVLTILRRDSIIDWRKLSGNPNDSAIDSEFGVIHISDVKGNITFTWNPLKHLNIDLFRAKEKLSQLPETSSSGQVRDIRWLKLSSIAWDYDGNILYGIEDIGIGKISRKTGNVMWQFNYNDVPFIRNQDTLQCYSPYDFKLIHHDKNTAVYSFYERGVPSGPVGRGVVFEQDKKTKKIKLVKYIWPAIDYWSSGHGGFDYNYKNGDYVLDYGVFNHPENITSDFWDAFEYGRNDSTYAVYQVPKWNYMFGVHRLENFPIPPRPEIIEKGNTLEAVGNMQEWTWYALEGDNNTTIKKIGTGPSIKFIKGVTYCVAGPYGCGYAVSRPFRTGKK